MAKTNIPQAANVNEGAVQIQESFFLKNIKTILVAVVAIIVVFAGIFLYKEYVSVPNEVKASTEIAKAQMIYSDALQSGDSLTYVLALNGDTLGTKGFLAVADEFGGTEAGNLANLYAGLCYVGLNKWEEAKTYIEKYDGAGDLMVCHAANGALGNVYAHLGDLDKAVSLLKDAARSADNLTLSPKFLIQAGEILESQGKKDEAAELYKEVKNKYPQSIYGRSIDKYIERASVK